MTQQRAHMHDNPERCALAQPRHYVAARARRRAGPARLAHHAGAHDAPHVRHAVVAAEFCAEFSVPIHLNLAKDEVDLEHVGKQRHCLTSVDTIP
jgi:hypothetical protein